MAADETVAAELELMRAMFSEEELQVNKAARLVCCLLQPRMGGEAASRHVQAWLQIELPPSYPEEAPLVTLQRTRGLIHREESRLLGAVRACAEERHGECCVHNLVESGADVLTDINRSGDCPVCYDALFEGAGPVFMSPCFHSFHAPCIGAWWHSYVPPSGDPTGETPTDGAEAAAMAARAATAEARVLLEKRDACEASLDSARLRVEALKAVQGPPAPAAALRSASEHLLSMEREALQLRSRADKGTCRADSLAARAEQAAAEEEARREALPLPCPICREPIAVEALRTAGLVPVPPPAAGDGIITRPLTMRPPSREGAPDGTGPDPTPPTPVSPPPSAPREGGDGAPLASATASLPPGLAPGLARRGGGRRGAGRGRGMARAEGGTHSAEVELGGGRARDAPGVELRKGGSGLPDGRYGVGRPDVMQCARDAACASSNLAQHRSGVASAPGCAARGDSRLRPDGRPPPQAAGREGEARGKGRKHGRGRGTGRGSGGASHDS